MTQEEFVSSLSFIRNLALHSNIVKYPPQVYDIFIDYIKGKPIDLKCFSGKNFCHLSPEGLISPSFIMKKGENIDGISHGFVNAFYQLQHKHDNSCYTFCLPGMDMTYLLNPIAVRSHIKTIMSNAVKRL